MIGLLVASVIHWVGIIVASLILVLLVFAFLALTGATK